MFKRFISTVLVIVLSLVLFAGCSSSQDKKEFDAQLFVNECKILTPAGQYKNIAKSEFSMIYTKNVFDEFGKSDYYKNMNEEQRFEAIEQLGEVLETYSYGPAEDGFVWDFTINKKEHSVSWTVKYYNDTKVMWMMPGY